MIKALIGIRGFAAIWVVLYHFRPMLDIAFPDAEFARRVVHSGFLGVDLFAVLSGFVIAMTYSERLARPSVAAVTRFLWLRVARIYPLLVFALGSLWLARLVRVGFASTPALLSDRSFWLQLLMLNGWGLENEWAWNVPSWTVSAEWLCYLLFPLAAPLIGRVRSGGVAASLAALTIGGTSLTLIALEYPDFGTSLDWGALRIGGEFLTGCWLYRAFAAGFARDLAWSTIGAVFLVVAVLASTISAPATACSFVVVVYALARDTPLLRAIFGSRMSVYFGEISYSLYMMHWLVVTDVDAILDTQLDALPVGMRLALLLALLFALSTATYFGVERPSRAWLRKRVGAT